MGAELGLAGAALGGAADLGKIVFGLFQNHKANQINPVYNPYEVSPYARQQLGLAQQLFNAPAFGQQAESQNIAAGQANYANNVAANATDSAQALQLMAQSQAASNNAYNNQQIKRNDNQMGLLNNLNAGYRAMVGEGDKVYNDMLTKYQMDSQAKAALRNSAWSNIFGGVNDAASGAMLMNQQQQQNDFNNRYLNMMGGGVTSPYVPGNVFGTGTENPFG